MKTPVTVHVVLDKSGSMEKYAEAIILGYNDFVQRLRSDQKVAYKLALTLFDTRVLVGSPVALKDAVLMSAENYCPHGAKALYDAIFKSIKATNGKHIVLVVMDAIENASLDHSSREVKHLVESLGDKWTFVFLGARHDPWEESAKIGFRMGNTMIFRNTPRGQKNLWSILAKNVMALAAASAPSTPYFFSVEDSDLLKHTI